MAKKKMNKKQSVNKKGVKKSTDTRVENMNSVGSLWKIIIIIMLAFTGFYVLTYFIAENNKSYSWENRETSSVIQYDEIIFGTMLSESPKEYYVLAINYSNENKDIFDTYISMYKEKENSLRTYTVDLDSDFNKKYINENGIKETTLFKIKNSKIVERINGEEKVIKKFKELIK